MVEAGLRILPGTGDIYDICEGLGYTITGQPMPDDLALALLITGASRYEIKLVKEAGTALGKVAQQADSIVSQSGRIGGILKHSEAEKIIKESITGVRTEISYLNGKTVTRGTPVNKG